MREVARANSGIFGSRLAKLATHACLAWFGAVTGGIAVLALADDGLVPTTAADQVAAAESPKMAEPERLAADSIEADADGLKLLRLREGTRLTNRLGRFRQDGDSVTFVDEEGRELGGLPNLGLERIIRALKGVDEPESVWWSVSGTVTEFSGRNYLLVGRAVYKAATLPPSPESVE